MADNQNNNDMVNPIQIQKFLSVDYPVDKQTLIETAKSNGADEKIISTLEKIPERTYNGPNAVSEEIGKLM